MTEVEARKLVADAIILERAAYVLEKHGLYPWHVKRLRNLGRRWRAEAEKRQAGGSGR